MSIKDLGRLGIWSIQLNFDVLSPFALFYMLFLYFVV